MRDYSLYLEDILVAIKAIKGFVKGMEFEDFEADDKTSSAVVKKLEIIGEAAKKMPDSIKKKYPQILWKEMAGMRDKLTHFYFGINYNLVWKTIKERLPELVPSLKEALREL